MQGAIPQEHVFNGGVDSSRGPGGRVHFDVVCVLKPERPIGVSACSPLNHILVAFVSAILHSQWRKDPVLKISLKRLESHLFNNPTQYAVARIAIAVNRSRFVN